MKFNFHQAPIFSFLSSKCAAKDSLTISFLFRLTAVRSWPGTVGQRQPKLAKGRFHWAGGSHYLTQHDPGATQAHNAH